MKIIIEIPDTTNCAFFNYVYTTSTGMSMGVKSISTDDIRSGDILVCNGYHPTEKGGANE